MDGRGGGTSLVKFTLGHSQTCQSSTYSKACPRPATAAATEPKKEEGESNQLPPPGDE